MTAASNKLSPRKKLKDSCTACAVAKVKCNREKPTCTRCQDRSFTCFYEVSQRSGRKSTASLATTGTGNVTSKSKSPPSPPRDPSPGRTPNQLVNDASPNAAPSPKADTQPLMIFDQDLGQDTSFGCFDMVDFSPQPSLQTFDFDLDLDIDMDNGMGFDSTLPTTLPLSTTLSADTLQSTASSSWASSFPLSAQTSSATDPVHVPQPSMWTSVPVLAAHQSQPIQPFTGQTKAGLFPPAVEQPTDMMGMCCLTKSSQILAKLRASKSRCVSSAINSVNISHNRPSVAQVIVANRRHFQSTVEMLNCSCASDRYILFMIAPIIFGIIAEYAEVARPLQQPEQTPTLPDLAGMPQEQKESPRLQAHLILGELYRVVRMIELFANVHRQMQTDSDISMLDGANGPRQSCHDDNAIPISIFGQMEADLRERLRMARASTLEVLRRY